MYSKLFVRIMAGILAITLLNTPFQILAQDDGEELTETFVSSDNVLSFDYPTGWYAEELLPGIVLLSNNAVIEDDTSFSSAVSSGDLFIGIFSPQAMSLAFDGVTPDSMEQAFELFTETTDDYVEIGEAETLEINERDALVVTAVSSVGDGLVYVLDFDGEYVIISASTATGELDNFSDSFLAIVETIEYGTPADVLTFEESNLSFDYPTDWHAEEFWLPGVVFIGNDAEVVGTILENDTSVSSAVSSGDLFVTIVSPQAMSLAFEGVTPDSMEHAVELFSETAEDDAEIGEAETLEINERDALIVTIVESDLDTLVYVLDFDGEYVIISANTATGEIDNFSDSILAIVETIEYGTLEDVLTFEGLNLSFDYPADWITFEVLEGNYLVMNEFSPTGFAAPGYLMITILEADGLTSYSVSEEATTTMIAEDLVDTWIRDEKEVSAAEDILIGDYSGIKVAFASEEIEGYVLVLEVDGEVVAIVVTTAISELEDYETEVMALVESIIYSPSD